jgi:hypothetical protein
VWERLAVTEEQVTEFGLEPITRTDNRYRNADGTKGRTFGRLTEALGKARIVQILTDRLEELMPERLDAVLARQEAQRDAVREVLERLGLDGETS